MVEYLGNISKYLGLPINASSHGHMIDNMIGWVHWLMILLFMLSIFQAGIQLAL